MKTIIGSFVLTAICSLITTVQALFLIGGFLGLLIGLGPLISWVIIFPFYLLEKD